MLESSDYVKYVTERVAAYLDTEPTPETAEQRELERARREKWTVRWFGFVGLGMEMWWSARKRRRGQKQANEGTVRSSA